MTDRLRKALEAGRQEIEAGLVTAEQELERLRQESRDLERLIARGRAALGQSTSNSGKEADVLGMSLHEAMEVVLSGRGNQWTSPKDVAETVNSKSLYRMRDGRPVEVSQIHARARNYEFLFERSEGKLRMRFGIDVEPLDKAGAYEAAMATVTRSSDKAQMFVIVHVAYSVRPPEGELLGDYAARLADERARHHLKTGLFEPGREWRWLLTTHGWEPRD